MARAPLPPCVQRMTPRVPHSFIRSLFFSVEQTGRHLFIIIFVVSSHFYWNIAYFVSSPCDWNIVYSVSSLHYSLCSCHFFKILLLHVPTILFKHCLICSDITNFELFAVFNDHSKYVFLIDVCHVSHKVLPMIGTGGSNPGGGKRIPSVNHH